MNRRPLQNDLEPLLAAAGLSGAAIEILLNLALGPARPADLAHNAKLLGDEEVHGALAELDRRRLLRPDSAGGDRLDLVAPDACPAALGSVPGGRLALLLERVRAPFVGGMGPNPAQPSDDRLAAPYPQRRAAMAPRVPQVEVKVQTACNIRCRYCFIRRAGADTFDTAGAKAELARARSGGIDHLILTGGEPTIRRDLPALIAEARRLGFADVQLFSNGLMFAYRDLVDACARAGLTSIVLHLSSVDRQVYRRLTGRDHLETVQAGMRNLARHPHLAVEVITVINRLNLGGLTETIAATRRWQAETGFAWFANQIPFCCVYSSSWDNRDEILLPMEQTLDAVEAVVDRYGHERWPLLFMGYPLCLLPGREAHAFELYATLVRQLLPGRRLDYTFLDTMFIKPAGCRSCRHQAYCVGLSRGYARLYGTGLLSPVGAEP